MRMLYRQVDIVLSAGYTNRSKGAARWKWVDEDFDTDQECVRRVANRLRNRPRRRPVLSTLGTR